MAAHMVIEPTSVDADYVVVGAGSAGCVIAARLSEDARTKVVLLEAGARDTNPWIHIPLGFGKTFADPRVNWCYETETDPGANDRRIFWPRGKVLGGSSSINGMVYVRGQPEDFDHWRQLGNRGWSFGDVLPYFKRAEHQTRGHDHYHGVGGPLWVSDIAPTDPISDAFIKSAAECGIPENDDFNGAVQEGVGYQQTTMRHGRRCSTAVGYLRPAMKRNILTVILRATAEQIELDGTRATAVLFRRNNRLYRVRASREVILCGGSINTPQLLMLSGIGPYDQLAGLGIAVRHNLPGVGQCLQDHYSAPIKLKSKFPITVNDIVASNLRKVKAGLEYVTRHSGALALPAATAALFARTDATLASPDVKCAISPFSADRWQDGLHKWSGFTLIAFQLRPESRGEITLKSSRPQDMPSIRPNYLSADLDQRTIVAGLRLSRRVLANPRLGRFVEAEYLPGKTVDSDDELLDHARVAGSTVFHPTSTCRMGSDPLAVVDQSLRVHGIDGLRIVDASIMPTVISGNTNAATIMIAEKAADLIRNAAQRLAA
jgi:choline dehydrogenase